MASKRLVLSACALSAALACPAQQPAANPPAPLQVPNPHYVTVVLTEDVNAPAEKTWEKIGGFCDIGKWAFSGCTLVSGDGGMGSRRSIVNEVMVGQSRFRYTYSQPVRVGAKYNLYNGTLEAQPVTSTTSRLVYTFMYDNSMLADDDAREKEIANRKARFAPYMKNMKTLAEGGTIPAASLSAAPAAPTPDQLQVPAPHYVAVPFTVTVNAPVDKVWERVGNFCDAYSWTPQGCHFTSGSGELGTVRSVASEILVAKTKYSYTYTQPVREGVKYNLYHGTLEAVPASATTTTLKLTQVYDDSLLADDAAREAERAARNKRFTSLLQGVKVLAEGGKPSPESYGNSRPAPAR